MESIIYDAHGNRVDPLSAKCARCGQLIKNVFWYKGESYGCECINTKHGKFELVMRNGQLEIYGINNSVIVLPWATNKIILKGE